MSSPRRSHAPVRYYELKKAGFLDGTSPELALVRSCARIRGWLHASLARGAEYVIWNKHAFARRSGLRMHYVEQAMRTFRKTTTEFEITEIRLGRSPRLKITYRGAAAPGSIGEVRRRLLGYIRTAATGNRGAVAKVDARFLDYFIKTSGLPREVVGQVWLRLSFVPGCRCHWRGVGANLRLVVQKIPPRPAAGGENDRRGVSLQETSLPHGSPTGRRYKKKTVAPAALGGEQSGPRAQPVGMARDRPGPLPSDRPPWQQRTPSDFNPQTTMNREARQRRATTGNGAGGRESKPASPLGESFQVGGRFISGEKIMRFATWLAVEPMQANHAGARVRWRFAHARNFAARALRYGHRAPAILAAYAAGVRRSHDDAGLAGETARDHAPREPSAAVCYGWEVLRADTRGPADRGAEILGGARAPRLPRVRVGGAPAAPERALQDLQAARGAAAQLDSGGLAVETIEQHLAEHLRARGMTLVEYNLLPWDAKKRLLQATIAQQLHRGGKNKEH